MIAKKWSQFTEMDLGRIRKLMASPCIVDARNLLDDRTLKSLGFRYLGVGRPIR